MNKAIKIRILRRALRAHRYQDDAYVDFDNLGERVEDEPTDFIETCIEEAYKEGIKQGGKK